MAVVKDVERYMMEHEPVQYVYSVNGFSQYGSGPNWAMFFVTLKDWKERRDARCTSMRWSSASTRLRRPQEPDGALNPPPPLPDLGLTRVSTSGCRTAAAWAFEALTQARQKLLAAAAEHPALTDVVFAGQEEAPQLQLRVDRDKAQARRADRRDQHRAGGDVWLDYIGDFMLNGQVRRVTVQADGKRRVDVDDISRLHVRNLQGQMVPLSAFATLKWSMGPPQLNRRNGFPSFTINGSAAPGHSSGEASVRAMEALAAELPRGIGFDWSGQSYEERLSGNQAPVLFALSVIVFLALAALYESWSIPLGGDPGGAAGRDRRAAGGDRARHAQRHLLQYGLIATIGLSAKNAILIVEVAKDLVRDGQGILSATLEGRGCGCGRS